MLALSYLSSPMAAPEPTPIPPEALPEMALLEYLADMEQVDGQWVSALDMQSASEGKEQNKQTEVVKSELADPEDKKREVKK